MDIWKRNHNVVLHGTEKRNPFPEHYMREGQLFISVSSQSIIVTSYCVSAWFTYDRITKFLLNNPLALFATSSLHFLEKVLYFYSSIRT